MARSAIPSLQSGGADEQAAVGSTEWILARLELAGSYLDREEGNGSENLEIAIKIYEQALEQVTEPQVIAGAWSVAMVRLANAYNKRKKGQESANIARAIEIYEQSLKLITYQLVPQYWAWVTSQLSLLYYNFNGGDRAENLEQVILLCQQVLNVYTRQAKPVEWADTMHTLATAYSDRIRGDRSQNQELAIAIYQQALQVRKQSSYPLEWSDSMHNLASVYLVRIRGERIQNQEAAIRIYQQVLQVRTRESNLLKWADSRHNLASAYYLRIAGNRAQNLEQAITIYEQLLSIIKREKHPVKWAMIMYMLATAYLNRIRGDRAINLEKAIFTYHQTLQVYTRENRPVQWARSINALAGSYSLRVRGNRAQNLEKAIYLYEQALQVTTRQANPIEWAQSKHNLAGAYKNRVQGNRAHNLEQAIDCYQQALQVTTRQAMPTEWAETMTHLATVMADRMVVNRAENLQKAIDYYHQALEVRTRDAMPLEWAWIWQNLAPTYADQAMVEQTTTLDQAIDACQQALQVQTLTKLPSQHYLTQKNLGAFYFEQSRWQEAYTAYAGAYAAMELLYEASMTPSTRQSELKKSDDLPARMAYCLTQLKRLPEAVTMLEHSKARALSEALTRQEAMLNAASTTDQAAFSKIRERIHTLEVETRAEGESWARDWLVISEYLQHARQELSTIIERIRQDVPDFMPSGMEWADILSLAKRSGYPLVYLLTTAYGTVTLMVLPNPTGPYEEPLSVIHTICDENFNRKRLSKILYNQGNKKRYLYGTVAAKSKSELEGFKQVLGESWPALEQLMAPIANNLQALGYQQAVLIPTGTLSLLPLHAMSQKINFTYAPSARALQSVLNDHDYLGLPPALLGIGNPLPTSQPLPFAQMEVSDIAPLFAIKNTFYAETATREQLSAHLSGTTHLHFSCHGAFNIDNPLNSALDLANSDTLTLRDLLDGKLDIKAIRLVVLSACQTGITDFQNVPDEAIGFPAGFLQAGIPGIVSSLWPVADISTALLLTRFYRYHLQDGSAPSVALWQAQRWLREVTAEELAKYFAKKRRQRSPTRKQASAAWRRFAAMEPDTRPFAHPYYWAAFTFTGV